MKKRFTAMMMAMVLCFTMAMSIQPTKITSAATLFKVHYIEVGTGDAALLQYGSGSNAKYALIDAGPLTSTIKGGSKRDVSNNALNYLKKYNVKHLEFVILTHPHVDHIGGMISILQDESIAIGTIYQNGQLSYNHFIGDDDLFSTSTYRTVNALIEQRGIQTLTPTAGSSIYLGKAKITFYGPTQSSYTYGREVDFKDRQINKYSIVCKIVYGKNSFLMTGDTQQESEYAMMKKYNVSAQVLKVPHHGYEDVRNKDAKGNFSSNHKKFFDKVAPVISIISNGWNNKDNVPSNLITSELSKSSIYTTGTNGNIIVTSNGKKLSVSSSGNKGLAALASTYITKNNASRNLSKMQVKSSGKKKIDVVSTAAKNKYKIKEYKNIKLTVKGKAKDFTNITSVEYKLVKKGKSASKYAWKKGKSVKVKKGFKGRLYIKYNTSVGSTVVKTKGFVVQKKKKKK